MSAESKTSVANEAALQRQLEAAATDDDTRTIARIMAEIAEEAIASEQLLGSA